MLAALTYARLHDMLTHALHMLKARARQGYGNDKVTVAMTSIKRQAHACQGHGHDKVTIVTTSIKGQVRV